MQTDKNEEPRIWTRVALTIVRPRTWRDIAKEDIAKIDSSGIVTEPEIGAVEYALRLLDAGAIEYYTSHPDDKVLIDMWVKDSGFAGLTLEDFIARAKNDT